ncbi:hypothetical protein D3C85_1195520 [compost metagenome]
MTEVGAQDREIADDGLGEVEDVAAHGPQMLIGKISFPAPAAEYLRPEQSAVLGLGQQRLFTERDMGLRVYGGRIVGPDMQFLLKLVVLVAQS